MSARRRRSGPLASFWSALRRGRTPGGLRTGALVRALPRLASATLSGRYQGLSRGRLLLMAGAALYVLSPVDLLPEGLLGPLGLVDDAAVLAWLAGAVISEGEAFVAWERSGGGPSGPGGPRPPSDRDAGPAPRGAPTGRAGGAGEDGPDVVPGEVIR